MISCFFCLRIWLNMNIFINMIFIYFFNYILSLLGFFLICRYFNNRFFVIKSKIYLPAVNSSISISELYSSLYKNLCSYNIYLRIFIVLIVLIILFWIFINIFLFFFKNFNSLQNFKLKVLNLYYIPYIELNNFLLQFKLYSFFIKHLIFILFYFCCRLSLFMQNFFIFCFTVLPFLSVILVFFMGYFNK